MRTRFILPVILVLGLIGYFMYNSLAPRDVSLLLVNGVVYTVNDENPVAEAIAVQGDRIAAVGSTEEIRRKFSSVHVIDLKGKPVYPGFVDSHAHLEGLGALLTNLDLGGTSSVDEVQRLVSERINSTPPGGWVRGRGWDQNKWRDKSFPTRQMLDAVAKGIPVYLTRVDGHAVWVNSRVLEVAGITAATRDPEGGRIIRDAEGYPTGVFVDNAIDLLEQVLPAPSVEERTLSIRTAVQECLRVGLTEVHDMGVDLAGIEIYKKLISAGEFPFRVYAVISGATGERVEGTANGLGEAWEHYLTTGPEIGKYDGRLTVRALKLYADGALGSRGAALIEPYSDDPGNRGLTLTSADKLKAAALQALEHGFQLCTHAIGDRSNHIVLGVYEEAFKARPEMAGDVRFRIEHAQVLEEQDIPRFAQLGILPMMQPTHCTSDMYWAEDRLGPKRVDGAYAWRSLMNQGSIVPAGSDFPVESPNPLLGFYAAITRQDRNGWPEGGWHPEQRMTREEALKAFTLWGAFASFEEHVRGTIEPGKLADLVVLSDDIMTEEPASIPATSVLMTVVGGKIVYDAGTLSSLTAADVSAAEKGLSSESVRHSTR